MKENKLELIIPKESIGKRADIALQELMSAYSRAKVQEWIKSGFILLENKKISSKDIMRHHDVLLEYSHSGSDYHRLEVSDLCSCPGWQNRR